MVTMFSVEHLFIHTHTLHKIRIMVLNAQLDWVQSVHVYSTCIYENKELTSFFFQLFNKWCQLIFFTPIIFSCKRGVKQWKKKTYSNVILTTLKATCQIWAQYLCYKKNINVSYNVSSIMLTPDTDY